MNKKDSTREAFEGKDFYLGIDVSKKNWAVSIRSKQMLLSYKSMEPQPQKLWRHMKKSYPGGTYHTVYEAGFCGFWIHRELSELGFKSIVVNAADVPTTDKERDRKTDAIDARKLGKELEGKNLDGIYIPEVEAEQIRGMARLARSTCSKERTRWKNRITSYLDYYGIQTPSHSSKWSQTYIKWLENLELDRGPGREALLFKLEELKQFQIKAKELKKSLKKQCGDYFGKDLMKNLYTLPGIGWDTVLTLLTELIDINRFSTFDHLKAYAGVIPSCHDTGETHKDKGVTKRRNRYLRYILIESSWVAIRKDPELFSAYLRYSARMKPQEAIIRIAKKLLKRIYCVWKENRPYEYRSPSRN